jgi:hypothetical protein
MDRRTLLKTGAAGSIGAGVAGTLGIDGCAHVSPVDSDDSLLGSLDAKGAESYLRKMDRRLAWIDTDSGGSLMSPLPPQCSPERQAEYDRFGRLFRVSARSLYMTGCFLEAPEELQAHPGMQARMATAQEGMDEAVFGTADMLESLTPNQHQRIRQTLREKPELAEDLARFLDAPAKADDMPLKRRYLLRSGILDLATKMQAQSPALVIDPYVRKVRRIQARDPASLAADSSRLAAARIGEEAFWAYQERLAKLAVAWERKLAVADAAAPATAPPHPASAPPLQPYEPLPSATPPPAAPSAIPPPATPAPPGQPQANQLKQPPAGPKPPPLPGQPTGGQKTLTMGGHIMGYGLGSIGVGLLFAGLYQLTSVSAFVYPAVVLGVTVGPVLLVIGLLVVIVGAIIRATEP